MNAERYAQGIPLVEYINENTGRRRLLSKLAEIRLPAEVTAFFQRLAEPLHALVITEPWCPSTPMALSLLLHCVELSEGRLQGRVFSRDANPDVMDEYLKEGKYRSIPVVAFFDAQFNPLGDIRERPSLPEWEGLDADARRQREANMDWSELWGRAYMHAAQRRQ